MKFCKEQLLLYAVTDRAWENNNFLEQTEEALLGGATCLQLREKEMSTQDFITEAIEVKKICEKHNVPLIINDNIEVAVACNADGIHVGQDDCAVEKIKSKYGDRFFVGVSAHDIQEALKAEKCGADYLGLGAVFSTNTKLDVDVMTKETLQEITSTINIPTVAIGGIKDKNIHELKDTGVDGVAVVSAIFAQPNIKLATKELLKKAEGLIYG